VQHGDDAQAAAGRDLGHPHRRDLVAEVEERGGLVEQQDARLLGERAREEDPTPLAARERVEAPVGEVDEVARLERPLDGATIEAARDGEEPLPRRATHHDRLTDREWPGDARLLRDERARARHRSARRRPRVETGEQYLTPLRREQPRDEADERRLPRAVRPEEADELARARRERHVLERRRGAVRERRTAHVHDGIG
jgi:hypothetical protein